MTTADFSAGPPSTSNTGGVLALPAFPWDALTPFAATAAAHPQGLVDLSVGTPVDDVAPLIQQALTGAANSPGYPTTQGTQALREAAAGWLLRQRQVQVDPQHILPTVGSKELVAWLPTLLGLNRGQLVVHPRIAYPTYAIGAQIAGCQPVAADLHHREQAQFVDDAPVALVWVNSPANPTGAVLEVEQLRQVVQWARQRGAVVVSDECYAGFEYPPHQPSPCLLHPQVCQGSQEGLLVVHSLSKRSNLAGYRAGILTGDPHLVDALLQVRKHAGMMVPAPVQHAMAVAYADDAHAEEQRQRYQLRRQVLMPALTHAGFRVEDSQAGLYLWVTRDEDCWLSLGWLAQRGVLAAPGSFYGSEGQRHVRVALTASDDQVAAAAARLSA